MRALVVSAAIALAGIPAAFSVRSLPPSVPAQQPASTQRAVESASAPGVVTGVVSDLHGAARSGVRVELLCDDRPPATTRTDGSGRFTFERVAPGICEVRASSDGLAAATAYVAITDLPSPPVRLSLGVGLADGHADVWAGAARQAGSRVDGAAGRVPGGVAGGVVGGLAESMAAAPPPASARSSGEARRAVVPPIRPMPPGVGFSTAAYDRIDETRFRRVADEPLSTFSTDVDTASYSNVRRFLNRGTLPPADAVRIEELVNYFRFPYDSPRDSAPVAIASDVAPCPWNPRHRLALIGIQARRDDPERAVRRMVHSRSLGPDRISSRVQRVALRKPHQLRLRRGLGEARVSHRPRRNRAVVQLREEHLPVRAVRGGRRVRTRALAEEAARTAGG